MLLKFLKVKNMLLFQFYFVLLWQHTSLYMIIFIANLQRIPKSVFEAATIDGATEGIIIRKIVLPALAGVIYTCSVLAISGSLKSFDLVFAMTVEDLFIILM